MFVTGRFSLAALYYAGVAAYGNDFATDLGKLNEEYVLEQLDQLSGVGAAVSGEIEYEKSTFSTDGFVVLPDQVLLVEVKSRRPALDKRLDAVSYTNLLGKDVRHAQDQLRTTYGDEPCAANDEHSHLRPTLPPSATVRNASCQSSRVAAHDILTGDGRGESCACLRWSRERATVRVGEAASAGGLSLLSATLSPLAQSQGV